MDPTKSRRVTCDNCKGKGTYTIEDCGEGWNGKPCRHTGVFCQKCNGTGKILKRIKKPRPKCPTCGHEL